MKKNPLTKIPFLSAFAGLIALTTHAAPLIVTPTNDAATLVNSVLGSGVTVVGVPTYVGANAGAGGTFSGGLDLIGISSGLLLTTGNASGAPGPNDNTGYSGLGTLTSLRFDFTTIGGDLAFNYVFASEEYLDVVHFNDVFQLLVDGVNVAKIPGTNTDVSIDNINETTHASLFNNNSDGVDDVDLQYDGFTNVFTASAKGLAAGTHTVEFLIADDVDESWDSAVFIQAGSFSVTPTRPDGGSRVPDTGSSGVFVALGLAALAVLRRRFGKV